VHEGNRGEIEDLVAFASDLGVDVYKINRLNPMGRANEMIEAGGHALSIEEVLAFNEFVEQHLNVNYTIPVRFDIPVVFQSLATVRRFRQSHCAIEGILGVLADGRASICGSGEEIEQLVFGDVRRQTVSEIWHKNQSLQHIREEVLAERNGLCQRCMMKGYCIGGYCRAHAYARYGDFRAPFPFCQEAYDAGLFPKARLLE
jgi:radical SAM protein with 4Fe4S-binding SPASM domain